MKFSLLLLAAGLCSLGTAAAQTTPNAPNTPNSASPSAVPSGMPPQAADPNGPVTPGKVFTAGAPQDNSMSGKRMKMRKKDMKPADKAKMKTKM